MAGEALPLVVCAADVPADALRDAFNVSFSDYLIKFPTLDGVAWQAFLRRQGIDLPLSFAACRGETVVAFAVITPRPLRRTRIAIMGARPSERGSGAAKRVLDDAIAASAARGDQWIELEAFAQNTRAVALYRSRGLDVVTEQFGFFAEPGCGLELDEPVSDVSQEDAAQWASAFDRERPEWMAWQVGGECIRVAVGRITAWRIGGAQIVIQDSGRPALSVLSLLDRDDMQRDALRLVGAMRHRYPERKLEAPQLQRANGASRAFEAAGWEREPLHQFLMRRRFAVSGS